jgi:glycosyltransferase involved in cell wall biosynthesis
MTSICLVVQGVYDIDPRVRRKAEALISAGYSVDVLALRPPQGQKTYSVNGVNVRTVSLAKKRGSLPRYAFEYCAFFLWACIRLTVDTFRRRYAVIDVNTLPDFLIFAAVFTRWMGAKLVLDMHEITPEFYISKYGVVENSWLVRSLQVIEKISFNFADRVMTINEPIEDLLVGRGLARSKSTVIMNAVDEARFGGASGAPAAPDPASDKFVMVYHGTLTSLYGLDIAIEAFALVHQEMPGSELWIVGSGPEQDALAKLAQERGLASIVRLIGQVPASDIPKWLSQGAVGILPIRRDIFLDFAFPNKLPEFIIMGKAVLISRLKAIRHYFTDDALAYFEPNDPVDLSRQMVRLHQHPELRNRLTANAREEYAPIRWDVMKERYLAVVGDLIGAKVSAVAGSRPSAEGVNL